MGFRSPHPAVKGVSVSTSRRNFLKSSLAIAALATTAGVVSACSNDDDDKSSDNSNKNDRIAAIGWGDYCTLLAMDITPTLVLTPMGMDEEKDNGVGPWASDKVQGKDITVMAATSQEIGNDVLEKIAAAKPSKIIAMNSGLKDDEKKRLNDIAPTTVHSDKYADYQVPWDAQVKEIAKAVGKESDGDKLVSDTKKKFDDFSSSHPDLKGKKATTVIAMQGQFAVYTSGDGRGQFIKDLGFVIPDDLNKGDNGQFYKYLSSENLSQLDELDYLFLLDYAGSNEEAKKNPLFQNIKAVKEGNMREISQDTATAMSLPNPLTIPWAIEQFDKAI